MKTSKFKFHKIKLTLKTLFLKIIFVEMKFKKIILNSIKNNIEMLLEIFKN